MAVAPSDELKEVMQNFCESDSHFFDSPSGCCQKLGQEIIFHPQAIELSNVTSNKSHRSGDSDVR
jgi:hypothetical protein